jgi:hypothetical protein
VVPDVAGNFYIIFGSANPSQAPCAQGMPLKAGYLLAIPAALLADRLRLYSGN